MIDNPLVLVAGRHGQVAQSLAGWPSPWTVSSLGRGEGLDIADPDSVGTHIRKSRPALVVNAAAYTQVDRAETESDAAFAVNAKGPEYLAKACAEHGVPLIQISADYVFDGRKPDAYREDDATNPLGVYGASKAAGEAAVRQALPEHVVLRTSWVFATTGTNFVRTMLRLAETREELGVVVDQVGAPTYAADIAARFFGQDRRGRARSRAVRNVSSHRARPDELVRLRARDFPSCIQRRLSCALVKPISTADYPTLAERPRNSELDCSKIERTFGIRLPDWQDGLARCVRDLLPDKNSGVTA